MDKKIALFILRLFVGLFFISQSLLEFKLKYYINPTDQPHWITSILWTNLFISIGLFVLGILVLIGKNLRIVLLLSIGLVVLNHFFLLLQDPFYNYTELTLPILICCISLLITNISVIIDKDKNLKYWNRFDSKSIAYLSLRLFLGAIMFAQGFKIVFLRSKPLTTYVYANYIEPYEQSFLPKFSLWTMGYLNPFLLLIPGIMLLLGLKTRIALYFSCFFFISLIFGHLIETPYFGENMYASGVLCLLTITILYFENELNAYSIDKLLKKNEQ